MSQLFQQVTPGTGLSSLSVAYIGHLGHLLTWSLQDRTAYRSGAYRTLGQPIDLVPLLGH